MVALGAVRSVCDGCAQLMLVGELVCVVVDLLCGGVLKWDVGFEGRLICLMRVSGAVVT